MAPELRAESSLHSFGRGADTTVSDQSSTASYCTLSVRKAPAVSAQRSRGLLGGRRGRAAALAALVAGAATLLPVATAQAEVAPAGPAGAWTKVLADEFDGTALDSTKWEPNRYGTDYGGDTPFNPSAEDAWFGTRNVSVAGGNLALTVKPEAKTLNGKTYPYSSGMVQSAQHYLLKPGSYIEARIDVPLCDGCWPAFWTVSPKTWPPELDIFEFFGTHSSGQSRPFFNYHPPAGGQTGPDAYGATGTDYRSGFHVYGMLWDGKQAIPYVDGKAYPGATSDMTTLEQEIILNLSVQQGHKPVSGSQMLVDWLRVWRPATVGAPSPTATTTASPTSTTTTAPTGTTTTAPTSTTTTAPSSTTTTAPSSTTTTSTTTTTAATTYAYRNLELTAASTNGTLALDVEGASTRSGARVVLWTRNGGANQRWHVTQRKDGNHELVSANSGQCLTTDGVAGHALYQAACTGSTKQVWKADLAPSATVSHTLTNPATGLRVDVYGNGMAPGTVVDGWYVTGGKNQQFLSTQR